MNKRVLVTFTKEQWDVLDSLKGQLGSGDAGVVKSIVVNWLIEKDLLIEPKQHSNVARSQGSEKTG